MIHRDLKLSNLFMDAAGNVKAGDFGLACQLEYDGQRKTTICGTPNYIAPEILTGRGGHSYEVDIWSLGVLIYAMLLGRPPFETTDVKKTYRRIKANAYDFPTDRPISPEARDLIRSILHLDPHRRCVLPSPLPHLRTLAPRCCPTPRDTPSLPPSQAHPRRDRSVALDDQVPPGIRPAPEVGRRCGPDPLRGADGVLLGCAVPLRLRPARLDRHHVPGVEGQAPHIHPGAGVVLHHHGRGGHDLPLARCHCLGRAGRRRGHGRVGRPRPDGYIRCHGRDAAPGADRVPAATDSTRRGEVGFVGWQGRGG